MRTPLGSIRGREGSAGEGLAHASPERSEGKGVGRCPQQSPPLSHLRGDENPPGSIRGREGSAGEGLAGAGPERSEGKGVGRRPQHSGTRAYLRNSERKPIGEQPIPGSSHDGHAWIATDHLSFPRADSQEYGIPFGDLFFLWK
jgi:hypothetical protein